MTSPSRAGAALALIVVVVATALVQPAPAQAAEQKTYAFGYADSGRTVAVKKGAIVTISLPANYSGRTTWKAIQCSPKLDRVGTFSWAPPAEPGPPVVGQDHYTTYKLRAVENGIGTFKAAKYYADDEKAFARFHINLYVVS